MTKQFKRTDRIGELFQRKLAEVIQKELTPSHHAGFVTITEVKVSTDLSHAKVYFTVYNEEKKAALTRLNDAAGYLRSVLAKNSKLRTVPQLQFIYDDTIDYGNRLSRLINEANPDSEDDAEEV